MPELPEVETVARGLHQGLVGRQITDLSVFTPSIVACDAVAFKQRICGKTVQRIWRRGKLLIFDLSGDLHLVFHLKMTGRVWITEPTTQVDKHTHICFFLNNGGRFFFHDVRRFGYSRIFSPAELKKWDFFASLGLEPLEIGVQDFAALFQGRKATIKSLLLNQHFLAGIGNIYADEALFASKINPATAANQIPFEKMSALHAALQAVLKKAIAAGGSSIRDYRNAAGKPGEFQSQFLVYGKKGEPCPICSRLFETQKVAGRTSTFCANCQRLP